jgi:hypothetical protein
MVASISAVVRAPDSAPPPLPFPCLEFLMSTVVTACGPLKVVEILNPAELLDVPVTKPRMVLTIRPSEGTVATAPKQPTAQHHRRCPAVD